METISSKGNSMLDDATVKRTNGPTKRADGTFY